MQHVHWMFVDFRGKLFAHVRLESIIAVQEERIFPRSVFYTGHTSAVCAHIRVVGHYSNAWILFSRLHCDFSDIVWACIVHDNRLDVGESLIPYRIKTFLQVIADIVCGNDD